MIVADTNLLVYLFINGDKTPLAQDVLKKAPHWIVPPLWQSEFRNVLAGYIRRCGSRSHSTSPESASTMIPLTALMSRIGPFSRANPSAKAGILILPEARINLPAPSQHAAYQVANIGEPERL